MFIFTLSIFTCAIPALISTLIILIPIPTETTQQHHLHTAGNLYISVNAEPSEVGYRYINITTKLCSIFNLEVFRQSIASNIVFDSLIACEFNWQTSRAYNVNAQWVQQYHWDINVFQLAHNIPHIYGDLWLSEWDMSHFHLNVLNPTCVWYSMPLIQSKQVTSLSCNPFCQINTPICSVYPNIMSGWQIISGLIVLQKQKFSIKIGFHHAVYE